MRRWMIWGMLSLAAGLLGGSAIATPMSVQDYATEVTKEVDLQNMSCSEIEYLWHVFDEMTGRCPAAVGAIHSPPSSDSRMGLSVISRARGGGTAGSAPTTQNGFDPCTTTGGVNCLPPYVYTPPRICPDGLQPTYRLSPDMYAQLGTGMRDTLEEAGVPWDVDIQPGETRGRVMSAEQTFFPAAINALSRELSVASRLKNCRAL